MRFFTAVMTITEISEADFSGDFSQYPQYDVTVGTYATFEEAAARTEYVSDHLHEFLDGGMNEKCLSVLKVQVWTLGNDECDGEIYCDLMDGGCYLTDEERALVVGE